jgi:hypothetical protein
MAQFRTPGVVIAAASIMFVYGALLLICVGCSGLGIAMKDPHDQLGIEARLDKEAPGHMAVGIAGAAFNLLFAVALFACAVGVLFLSNIARYTTYLVCMAIPIVTLASSVYQTVVVFPVTERIMADMIQNQQKGAPPPFDIGMIMKGSAALSLLIALAVPLLFCGPIIVLISMKSARRAFAGDFDEPRPPWEDDRDSRRLDDDDAPRKPSSGTSQGDTGIQDHS